MTSELIINSTNRETRVALIEENSVAEFFIERKKDEGIVGNIYKGKVIKVLPGMQAAFVDIGLEKAGFLYVSDIDPIDIFDDSENLFDFDEEMDNDKLEEIYSKKVFDKKTHSRKNIHIEDMLTENQIILVQVTKNQLGTKGARLTSYISLPGRYIVFMPTTDQVAVSRRIPSEIERKRLKKIINELKEPKTGYIIRTVGEGHKKEKFIDDSTFLNKLWNDIKKKSETVNTVGLIHKDLNLVKRCIRDLEVKKILIDSADEFNNCIDFVSSYLPNQKYKIDLFKGRVPVFESYGLESILKKNLEHKIWLKSGGFIVIDQTEALFAIDINTGKYVGKKNQEETTLKTNLEALHEIVRQLRLRNIGGLIIIDFIDMVKKSNRDKVYKELEKELKKDRSRTTILKFSDLGIVEMARKRVRSSLNKVLCSPCPYCEGKGEIYSVTTVCYEIFREIERLIKYSLNKKKNINIAVNPKVHDMLTVEEDEYIKDLESRINRKIIITSNKDMHQEEYDIHTIK